MHHPKLAPFSNLSIAQLNARVPDNMNFIDSIYPVLCIWQSTGISLFELRRKCRWNILCTILKFTFSLTVTVIQLWSAYEKVSNISLMTLPKFRLTKLIGVAVNVFLFELGPICIVIESLVNRKKQKTFLLQIKSIDSILEQIDIDLHYKSQRYRYNRKTFRWMATNLFPMCAYSAVFYKLTNRLDFTWVKDIMPLIIVTTHYCRIAVLVDIVYQRYHLLNAHVERISVNSIRSSSESRLDVEGLFADDISISAETESINLWRVHRLIASTNNSIGKLFRWSLLLVISHDLAYITITFGRFLKLWQQLSFLMLLPAFSLILIFLPLIQTLPSINNILSLTLTCGRATGEVVHSEQSTKSCIVLL